MHTSAEIAAALRQEMVQSSRETELVSTGVACLDRLLPDGGLRLGSLVEYLGQGVSLAFAAACAACRERALIVVDRQREFYPLAFGIDLAKTVLVRPANEADEMWALDQALRCPGVGATIARCGRLKAKDFRRLQLAAESGGSLGLLLRSAKLKGEPTWADVQWLVVPEPSRDRWRLRVELVRCRGGHGGRSVILELDETNTWREVGYARAQHLSAELAHSANPRHQSRA